MHACKRAIVERYSECLILWTYICFHRILYGWGHHDYTDDSDQQEVEGVHNTGPSWLFNLGAAVTAAGAGRWATAAGQLYAQDKEGEKMA